MMFDYWKLKRAYNTLELNFETLKLKVNIKIELLQDKRMKYKN